MKFFLLIYATILIQTVSAQDNKWFIKEGMPAISPGQYGPRLNAVNGNILLLEDLKMPKPYAYNRSYCNDFFIIYSNGEYYMNRQNNTCSLPTSPTRQEVDYMIDFTNNTNSTVEFLYLTDRYEEDDFPENIELTTSASNATAVLSNAMSPFYSNHDIVYQNDITFIFDPETDKKCSKYKLCYELPQNISGFNLLPSSFTHTGLNNVISSSGNALTYEYSEFQLNGDKFCCDIDYTGSPVFLNFECEFDTASISQGQTVNFEYVGQDDRQEECITTSFGLQVNGMFHDPNHSALECLWEEDGRKYGIYHVECFNDGSASVPELSMSITLPPHALPHTVEIKDWMSCCTSGCGEEKGLYKIGANNDPLLKVKFPVYNLPGGDIALERYPPLDSLHLKDTCSYTAWFKFKVEFSPATDLAFDNLQPSGPITNFADSIYDIVPYYEDRICYSLSEIRKLNLYQNPCVSYGYDNNDSTCIIGRKISQTCSYCVDDVDSITDKLINWFSSIHLGRMTLFLIIGFGVGFLGRKKSTLK